MTSSGRGESASRSSNPGAVPGEQNVTLLYVGSREWFKSALDAVLQPEGFTVLWAHDAQEVLDFASVEWPDLLVLDEDVPGMAAPELCRRLRSGPLPAHVPIVMYVSDGSSEHLQAQALEAGAWEVIREPIRVESLVASLQRLLRIAELIGEAREDRFLDEETGLLTTRGLMRMLPMLGALARRKNAPLSCAVVGPTDPGGTAAALQRQREVTARLCLSHVREADLCGWLSEGDLAIVSFDTSPEGAICMARRLNALSREVAGELETTVSAGVAEMLSAADRESPEDESEDRSGGEEAPEPRVQVSISFLSTAREALQAVRRTGGGVRVVGEEGRSGD